MENTKYDAGVAGSNPQSAGVGDNFTRLAKIVPTPGRVVLYTLADSDVLAIAKQRGREFRGSEPYEGEVVPAIIIKTWGAQPVSPVNLKVLLDGEDNYWVTSRSAKDEPTPGFYHWMDYQKGQAAKTEAVEAQLKKAAVSA